MESTTITVGKHTYQYYPSEPGIPVVYVCIDCGASGYSPEAVKHYENCVPGESEKWEAKYNDVDLEADEQADLAYGQYLLQGGE